MLTFDQIKLLMAVQLGLVFFFAWVYYILDLQSPYRKDFHSVLRNPDTPNVPLNFFDAFYLSLVTQSTIGYGDIAPRSRTARIVGMIQMATTLCTLHLVGLIGV